MFSICYRLARPHRTNARRVRSKASETRGAVSAGESEFELSRGNDYFEACRIQ